MRQNLSGSWRKTGSRFLALLAVQIGAKMFLTSSDGEYPRAIDEGGLMPYVLSMATGQIGNPVIIFILVISDDRLLHITMFLASQMEGG
jgi:hypothetical protein